MLKRLRFRGVFFDLDGTLLDTTPLILKSFQHTFQHHFQRQVTIEDIQPFMGQPLRAAMTAMAPGQEDEVTATYRSFNLAHHDQLAAIFSGVHDTVKTLYEAGVKMAIVTSKTSATARRGLRLFNLEQYFEPVIGVEEVDKHKPDPEPVLAALRLTGLSPLDCLMVGDSPHDLISGQGAGLKTAAVRWTHVAWSDVMAAKPDYVLESMADILPIVFDESGKDGVVG